MSEIDVLSKKMGDIEVLQKTLQEINSLTYKKLSELEIGHKYHIVSLEMTKTMFGNRVCVTFRDFKCLIPEMMSSRFTTNHINLINTSNSSIYMVYNGLKELSNGKSKHDLVFVL